jgi:hypothetical protein
MAVKLDRKYQPTWDLPISTEIDSIEQEPTQKNQEDLLIDSTAHLCGIDRSTLKTKLEYILEVQSHIDLGSIHLQVGNKEQEINLFRINNLKKSLEKVLSTKTKYDAAQTKFNELNEQMMKQKEALEMAEIAKEQASQAFQQALALKNNPNKSNNLKTRLNKTWLNINQTYSRTNSDYEKMAKNYEACKLAVQAQTERLKEFQITLSSFPDIPQIEQEIQLMEEIYRSCSKNLDRIRKEIEDFRSSKDRQIEKFIQDEQRAHPTNNELEGVLRNFFINALLINRDKKA